MKGLFVTGTDTNIGKTFIACAIARVLKDYGVDVGVMKPFATSYKRHSTKFRSEDTWRLSRAANVADPDELINPYFYQIGTAPFLAASMSSKPSPKLGFVMDELRRLSKQHEFLVVEGIGGVMVPLSKGETVLDFIKMVGFPTIIVTSPKLGTINHTLLTFHACIRNYIRVYGIIVNKRSEKPSKAQDRIPSLLSMLTGANRVIEIPRIRNRYELKKIEKIIACEILDFRR
jgi:dethiobiotin synthetase